MKVLYLPDGKFCCGNGSDNIWENCKIGNNMIE